mmetsp:Transcript_43568/g.125764  ORF Transcript_43568/g.125764 Transcript_43568/m.125764 type:complete len:303 (+) Transcript_43568:513-1421(+)
MYGCTLSSRCTPTPFSSTLTLTQGDSGTEDMARVPSRGVTRKCERSSRASQRRRPQSKSPSSSRGASFFWLLSRASSRSFTSFSSRWPGSMPRTGEVGRKGGGADAVRCRPANLSSCLIMPAWAAGPNSFWKAWLVQKLVRSRALPLKALSVAASSGRAARSAAEAPSAEWSEVSLPASSRAERVPASPMTAASNSAVSPSSSQAFGSARASSSCAASCVSQDLTALISASGPALPPCPFSGSLLPRSARAAGAGLLSMTTCISFPTPSPLIIIHAFVFLLMVVLSSQEASSKNSQWSPMMS